MRAEPMGDHPDLAAAVASVASPRTGVFTPVGGRLPAWCDRFLAPPGSPDFFATRLWYDTMITHALQPEARPGLRLCGEVVLLVLDEPDRSLTTPYSLEWRPLAALDAEPGAIREAGRQLAQSRRFSAPLHLDTMAADAAATALFLEGAAAGGLVPLRFRHFGNWHAALPPDQDWAAYLAARPPAMRSTIQRKLARANREFRFETARQPGEELESAIAAYEDVRRRSWKPHEPFPRFDAQLLRATAANGQCRIGVLRDSAGVAVAAQYWIVAGGTAFLLKLCHAEASRAASPGTALTAMMIRGLIEEDRVRELDFGRGDDAYKQLWVGGRREREGVVLASPWHPAGLIAITRHRAARWLRRGAMT